MSEYDAIVVDINEVDRVVIIEVAFFVDTEEAL